MTTLTGVAVEESKTERRGRRGISWNLVVGSTILGVILLMTICAPLITHYDPVHQNVADALASPGSRHWLGTDQLGRDLWSRIVYGARVDLKIAFVVEIFPFAIGVVLGCLAGFYGGWVDIIIMRCVDIVMAFPFYVLIIALVFTLGAGALSIYIAFTAISWIWYTRLIRGEVLVAKRQEYVSAAKAAGLKDLRLMGRHILPNVITQAIIFAMSDIVLNILGIVTLGFLGLGIQPPTPEWGELIADGQQFVTTNWELTTFPGIAVCITALGLSLFADGLADVLRPSA
ncbi:MAG: peptide/nickel transport system permease protein [Nocardioidaceae bacterium]|jgi:peptide/nickel transport system permease protein|nr:peptide/nickel transport system permease protein [Nocardioidaceae bacterium]